MAENQTIEKLTDVQAFGSSDEPKWKLVERVVALLEKSLTPDADVQHNVKLPDITTGHLRQCDVVVRYGKPPRQTLSIVEVQDRKSKVEIGVLQGWWEKMLAVGAQHLICVSALDYPQSVKDEVTKKRGPAVKLLRLRQVEEVGWPFGIAEGKVNITASRATFRRVQIELDGKSLFGAGLECKDTDALFWREGAASLLTPLALLDECIDGNVTLSMLPPGKHEGTFSLNSERRLWLEVKGQRQAILRLDLHVQVDVHTAAIPIFLSAYEQVNYNGTLGWAATAAGMVGEREIQMRMILVPQEDGTFAIASNELSEGEKKADGWFTFAPIDTVPSAGC